MHSILSFLKFLLIPFTLIYASVLAIRNLMFDCGFLKSSSFDLPIISVGNISVGGTGKTPHTEYLISILQNKYKLASLSRGYKRKSKGFILANKYSNSLDLGDEPMQMNRKFPKLNVAVDADRVNGVQQLITNKNELKLDCILLDDAYQHRYIKPGLSILLIDYNRPISHDYVMPMGRLRESASGKKRADIIIMSKCPKDLSLSEANKLKKDINPQAHQELYFTCLDYAPIEPVFKSGMELSQLNKAKNKSLGILLVTGIANPTPLKKYLSSYCTELNEVKFPDHYTFKDKDLLQIEREFDNLKSDNKLIITTEKDAIRFLDMQIESDILKRNMAYIPLRIEFLHKAKDQFDKHIHNFVESFN